MRQMLYKAPIGTPKTELSNADQLIVETSEQVTSARADGWRTFDEIVSGSLEAQAVDVEKPKRGRPRKVV